MHLVLATLAPFLPLLGSSPHVKFSWALGVEKKKSVLHATGGADEEFSIGSSHVESKKTL